MARVPMVTRTITSTKVTLMCADTIKAEIFNEVVIMPRTYKDDEKLLRAVRKKYESDTVKVIDIVDKSVVTARYGMTEDKFVESADLLPEKDEVPTEGIA